MVSRERFGNPITHKRTHIPVPWDSFRHLRPASASPESTLSPWLDDQVIDFSLDLLGDRFQQAAFFSVAFYTALMDIDKGQTPAYNYERVRNWGTRATNPQHNVLTTKKAIVIPIIVNNNHWTLAVLDLKNSGIFYYDSLSLKRPKSALINPLRQWLADEARTHSITLSQDPKKWALLSALSAQQQGCDDCGVFVIFNAWNHALLLEMGAVRFSLKGAIGPLRYLLARNILAYRRA